MHHIDFIKRATIFEHLINSNISRLQLEVTWATVCAMNTGG